MSEFIYTHSAASYASGLSYI